MNTITHVNFLGSVSLTHHILYTRFILNELNDCQHLHSDSVRIYQ